MAVTRFSALFPLRLTFVRSNRSGGICALGLALLTFLPHTGFAAANDGNWSALGSGMTDAGAGTPWIFSLVVSDTNLYAGGAFTKAGGSTVNYIAKWNGTSWSPLASGMNGYVRALAVSGTNLYAGGDFATAGGGLVNGIARWDGSRWSALGSGLRGQVHSLAVVGSDLYAGGNFRTADNFAANGVAKWNGSTWSELGSGLNFTVYSLAMFGGDIYAAAFGSSNSVARWDGSNWSGLGPFDGGVVGLAVSGGNMYAGGGFRTVSDTAANYIAKWNGSKWSALGSGMNNLVWALAVDGSNVYAGGLFTTAGGIPANRIAKWDGTSWSPLGSGLSGQVYSLAVSGNDVYTGGLFGLAGGGIAANIAKWSESTPDLAVTFLDFDARNGGLGFTYTNRGSALSAPATAKLFWASGTRTNDIVPNVPPIYSTNIPVGFAAYATNYVPESMLDSPPTNAIHFLLVLDSGDLIAETSETNNTSVLTNTFRHVVVVMMENRSFDHFLGWLPGADGRQTGLTYTNTSGQSFSTWHLAPHFQGCGCDDPDHSYNGGRIEFNNGFCDGWLRANPNDIFSIGYYLQEDLAFLGQAATNWTVCDRYFGAIMAETQPNRIYQHAAQTDSLVNRTGLGVLDFVNLPTIWDRLSQSNVTARYYKTGTGIASSVLRLWGPLKYDSITRQIEAFYQDCTAGRLPAVSFVDPVLTTDEEDIEGNDYHPHSDIRNGEAFLAGVYNAIVSSPNWSSTVLIINFDEWGGFFDHVAPPIVQVDPAEQVLGNDGRLGFRVPCLVISPWSRRGYVAHEVFDHTSVLKLIENRWSLAPLTVRDANANDLVQVLDHNHPNFGHPPIITNVPTGHFGGLCSELQIVKQSDGSYRISWDAACRRLLLQSAPSPLGPWSTFATEVLPPYIFTPSLFQGFFRFQVVN